MTPEQKQWVLSTADEAATAKHIWPNMAACEAALESGKVINGVMVYGGSELAQDGNNLFGMKQHAHPQYGTLVLPTKEWLDDGKWAPTTADWVKYPDVASCFADRMATLQRLAPVYPHYAAALQANDPQTYVTAVSQTWSTDPNRATKVLEIYNEVFPQPIEAMGLEDES